MEGNSEDLDWEDQDMCFFSLETQRENHHGKEHDLANRNTNSGLIQVAETGRDLI